MNAAAAQVNEGARRLSAVKATLAEIASAVGVGRTIVSYWRTGTKLPSAPARKKLAQTYAIPVEAWELAAGAEPDEGLDDDEADDDGEELDDTLGLVNERVKALRRRLRSGKLSETARAKTEETLAKVLALRSRHEREIALSLHTFLRGPEWAGIKETLGAALRPYPEALLAAAKVLEEIDR